MPCFNEEKIIERSYRRIKKVLEDIELDYEIILEEDGSTDNTGKIIKKIAEADDHVKALSFPRKRMGIGWGYNKLFQAATGDFIVTTDADLAVNPNLIKKFIEECKNVDIVVASRYFSTNGYPLNRLIFSRMYNFFNRLMFGIKIKDTQVGFQILKRKILDDLHLEFNGFVTNLEILVKAKKRGYKIKEIPVKYSHRDNGAFSIIKNGPRTLFDTFLLRLKISLD